FRAARPWRSSSRWPPSCRGSPTRYSTCWKLTSKPQIQAPMSPRMSATYRIQTPNPKPQTELDPVSEKAATAPPAPQPPTPKAEETVFPLGMVLDACPDIADYARGGIVNWRDFVATAALIRSMLGVSPTAYGAA